MLSDLRRSRHAKSYLFNHWDCSCINWFCIDDDLQSEVVGLAGMYDNLHLDPVIQDALNRLSFHHRISCHPSWADQIVIPLSREGIWLDLKGCLKRWVSPHKITHSFTTLGAQFIYHHHKIWSAIASSIPKRYKEWLVYVLGSLEVLTGSWATVTDYKAWSPITRECESCIPESILTLSRGGPCYGLKGIAFLGQYKNRTKWNGSLQF